MPIKGSDKLIQGLFSPWITFSKVTSKYLIKAANAAVA